MPLSEGPPNSVDPSKRPGCVALPVALIGSIVSGIGKGITYLCSDPVGEHLTREERREIHREVHEMTIERGASRTFTSQVSIIEGVLMQRAWYRALKEKDPLLAHRIFREIVEDTGALPYIT